MEMRDKLKKWIEYTNITQAQFADSIGVTKGSVSQWLTGVAEPTLINQRKIALTHEDLNIYWLWNKKGEDMLRNPVIKSVERKDISMILQENKYLKETVEIQKMLIDSLKQQLKV
jgi:transcriptional regulator with XRE-family HTH domain